jgi:hypothetical protein
MLPSTIIATDALYAISSCVYSKHVGGPSSSTAFVVALTFFGFLFVFVFGVLRHPIGIAFIIQRTT